MADDMTMIGRVDEGRHLFEELLSLRNDVRLLGEEWNAVLQCQVGNFPKALSHVPLVDFAVALEQRSAAAQTAAQ